MPEESQSRETSSSSSTPSKSKQGQSSEGRKVSFQEFVYLISSQALIQLGAVPNPVTGKTEVNLPLAQHSIEMLSMIEQKTDGNLAEAEQKVMANALYDLRMRYVQTVQQKKSTK